MKIRYSFSGRLAVLASWLYSPKTCALCGAVSYGLPLCSSCAAQLASELDASLARERCSVCGRPLISERGSCMHCRTGESLVSTMPGLTAFPAYCYVLRKKTLLFTWKISGDRSLTPFFAALIHRILEEKYPGLPVVPVPPRKGKIAEKGWDQIQELCGVLKKNYRVAVLNLLERKTVVQQKKLSRAERLSSLGAEYAPLPPKRVSRECRRKLGGAAVPESVVLLDDIITTGVTVLRAAQALKSVGVAEIHAVSLFYVP